MHKLAPTTSHPHGTRQAAREPAIQKVPNCSAALAPAPSRALKPSPAQQLQRMIGNRAIGHLLGGSAGTRLQRDGPAEARAPQPAAIGPTTLTPAEAFDLAVGRLNDSGGYFAAMRSRLTEFKENMRGEGWYAGGRREGATPSTAGRVATALLTEAAKGAVKKALDELVTRLGPVAAAAFSGAGAGAAAALLAPLVASAISQENYRPVIVSDAQKDAHQVFIESLEAVIAQRQDDLRTQLMTDREEMISSGGASLADYADIIQEATAAVLASYYADIVAAYLAVAPAGPSTMLETPHAVYNAGAHGFDWTPFVGDRRWDSPVAGSEIYVELRASGYTTSQLSIVRTVSPQLPSSVLAQMNDPTMTAGRRFHNLFSDAQQLVMEVAAPSGPARVVFDRGDFDIPVTPHFSANFCNLLYHGETGDTHTSRTGMFVPGMPHASNVYEGATLLYAWVLNRPLSQMHFSA